jgi:hypothetical protein
MWSVSFLLIIHTVVEELVGAEGGKKNRLSENSRFLVYRLIVVT